MAEVHSRLATPDSLPSLSYENITPPDCLRSICVWDFRVRIGFVIISMFLPAYPDLADTRKKSLEVVDLQEKQELGLHYRGVIDLSGGDARGRLVWKSQA